MKEASALARDLMTEFASRTGLSPPSGAPRRYLWTDAFAVCNFLELYRRAGDERFRTVALGLVEQVHGVLGRHRDDDRRGGWISGLGEAEGRRHPTAGGLRIGKELPERGADEPFDERLEWDRDGQYYHYLTKWMHALRCVSRVTGEPAFLRWARELARAAHAAFTAPGPDGRRKRMHWKMSVDLSRPLVPSMGQLDPLDGLITYGELQAAAAGEIVEAAGPDLAAEVADMADLCRGSRWDTDDPLGVGGLLVDAFRLARLSADGAFEGAEFLDGVLDSALRGLESWVGGDPLRVPAPHRLAFRELGLSIGLKAAARMAEWVAERPASFGPPLRRRVRAVLRREPLGADIDAFWLDRTRREARGWVDHRDINDVMLATSLAPDGFLAL